MEMTAKDVREVLETLAIHNAADASRQGAHHASRIARLQVNSWQAEIIRHSPEIKTATNPTEFRALMENPEGYVIFLPQSAIITADIIERICAENPLQKMVIWETND